jgi:beta-phosphoglucomutase-like phosphatase (HAD superfamily)
MSDLTAVIFDFDGTLVQLRPGPGQMDELRERLGALFAEVGIRSTLRPFYPEVDRALAAPRHLDDALRRRAVALIEEYELEFSRSSEPCPHAAQTWKAVASRFPCAVSSRNTRLAVHRTLSRHGIWDLTRPFRSSASRTSSATSRTRLRSYGSRSCFAWVLATSRFTWVTT